MGRGVFRSLFVQLASLSLVSTMSISCTEERRQLKASAEAVADFERLITQLRIRLTEASRVMAANQRSVRACEVAHNSSAHVARLNATERRNQASAGSQEPNGTSIQPNDGNGTAPSTSTDGRQSSGLTQRLWVMVGGLVVTFFLLAGLVKYAWGIYSVKAVLFGILSRMMKEMGILFFMTTLELSDLLTDGLSCFKVISQDSYGSFGYKATYVLFFILGLMAALVSLFFRLQNANAIRLHLRDVEISTHANRDSHNEHSQQRSLAEYEWDLERMSRSLRIYAMDAISVLVEDLPFAVLNLWIIFVLDISDRTIMASLLISCLLLGKKLNCIGKANTTLERRSEIAKIVELLAEKRLQQSLKDWLADAPIDKQARDARVPFLDSDGPIAYSEEENGAITLAVTLLGDFGTELSRDETGQISMPRRIMRERTLQQKVSMLAAAKQTAIGTESFDSIETRVDPTTGKVNGRVTLTVRGATPAEIAAFMLEPQSRFNRSQRSVHDVQAEILEELSKHSIVYFTEVRA